MKLSIVIPCYNEAKTIRAIVDAVRAPVAEKGISADPHGTSAKLIGTIMAVDGKTGKSGTRAASPSTLPDKFSFL